MGSAVGRRFSMGGVGGCLSLEHVRIPVTAKSGEAAWILIDREDFPRLPISLRLDKKGRPVAQIYVGRQGGRSRSRLAFLSRIILDVDGRTDVEVDHINRDPLDNRRANLRLVPARGANSQNVSSHRDSKSRYRGVSWDRTKSKWIARVWLNGRNVNLGRFDDEAEAGEVARAYRLEHMNYAID